MRARRKSSGTSSARSPPSTSSTWICTPRRSTLSRTCRLDVSPAVRGAADPEEQDEIVAALERGRAGSPTIDGSFFELLRRHLIEGMFGDPRWGGNAGAAGGG